MTGRVSVPSYRSNQPIPIHNKAIKLYCEKDFRLILALVNQRARKKYNLPTCSIEFRAVVKDKSTRCILERCIDGMYDICASELAYDKRKKMWKINLVFKFDMIKSNELDKNIVLGIDVGEKLALVASIYGSKERLQFDGADINRYRKQMKKRRSQAYSVSKYVCGGNSGHGRSKRCQAGDKLGQKESNYCATQNDKFSRAVINYAQKHSVGTIQMEDLEGISEKNKFLKTWNYYDLQQKIKYKAAEVGIDVAFVQPAYTSQRCSRCGFIHKENRQTQEEFKCLECGFTENADYNASQNLAIKDIDMIIKVANPK